ncbi:oligosaccharide flippase family protein [Neobacillus sp. 19]|uniref:oligosaccharide flippase family protein n=1 Tax=Neobacillus sp. 19 TaxID=3394458 RepID=UPI003BF634B0
MNQMKMGTLLTYVTQFVQIIITILYTPIMLRLLGQSEFGLYSLVISVTGVLSILDLGLGNTIVRYTAKYKVLKDKLTEYSLNGFYLILYTLIGLITLLLGLYIILNLNTIFSNSLSPEEIEKAKILIIISVINLSLSFPLGIFGSIMMAYEQFIFIKIISLVRIILNPCVMLPLLMNGYGSIAMVVVISSLNIISLLINIWYCFKKLKIKFHFNNWNSKLLKEISVFSFYTFLILIVDKIYWSTDQIILGINQGTKEVSIYSIGATFSTFFITFTSVISSLQLPRFTKLVTSGASDKIISDQFIKLSRFQFIIGCFIYGGFLYIGKDLIILWAGKGYNNSYYIALIIMTSLLFAVVQNSAIAVVQAKNLNHFRSIAQLIIALINIGLTIPLSIKYGGLGAAIATSVTYLIGNNIIMTIYYHKKAKLNMIELWLQLIRFVPSFLILMILLIFINLIDFSGSYFSLIVKVILYSGFYFTTIYIFNMNKYEKSFISSIWVKLKLN